MTAFLDERVLSVHHWTDRLFGITTTRDPALRSSNGHLTMIGLRIHAKPLLRADSIVSANHEERLGFLSIKVPDGPLTSRLQHIQLGDIIVVGRKATGALGRDGLAFVVEGGRHQHLAAFAVQPHHFADAELEVVPVAVRRGTHLVVAHVHAVGGNLWKPKPHVQMQNIG